MHSLGGSASISEQEDNVASILNLPEKEIAEIHKGNCTKLSYRLAWARNYLKRFGVLYNSQRGVWALTSKGQKTKKVNKTEVNQFVKSFDKKEEKKKKEILKDEESSAWENELLDLIKTLTPDAFERLCQRILRESGFTRMLRLQDVLEMAE